MAVATARHGPAGATRDRAVRLTTICRMPAAEDSEACYGRAAVTSLTTRAFAAALVAATLLTGLLGVATPERAEAAGTCVNGWKEQTTPDSEFISTPFDIITRGGEAAWIVGGSNTGVLALRWKDGKWRATVTKGKGHRGLVGG